MKRIAVFIIVLLMIVVGGCKKAENLIEGYPSQGEWKLVREAQTNGHFSGLSFADPYNGWAVGDSGRILHTNDGGNSWRVQESGTTVSLKCVHFATAQLGWIGGAGDSIGKTTNGGVSWTWLHPAGESRRTFMAISFANESAGWIVDNYGGIIHTEDGGITWTPQSSGTQWAITSVQFLDAKEGWATATNRVVLHTTNGGNTWSTMTLDTLNYGGGVTVTYTDVFFYTRSKGWIATNAGASNISNPVASVVYTSDTGKTWIVQPSPETFIINSIKFLDENSGWAASEGGILHTTDGGGKWSYEIDVAGAIFVDICFVDHSNGWAITFSGCIYRYQAL